MQAAERNRTTEEELRRLALVAARTDNAVIITDVEGRIEWVNAGFTRLTGYTLPEVEGRTPGQVLQGAETDRETVRSIREQLQRQQSFTAELINYTKEGRAYWVSIEAQPLHDEQGRVTHFMAIEQDITQRRRMEEELRQGAERLRALLHAMPDMLFRLKADGQLVDYKVPPEVTRSMPELGEGGANLLRLPLPEALKEATLARLREAIRTGELQQLDYASDEARYYEIRVSRSGPDEAVCIVRDVTERKVAEEKLRHSEEELRRHRDMLEERVRQATAQLIQSEKMASLGVMASGLAHEINNPVSYVRSNLGMLSRYAGSLGQVMRLYREWEGVVRETQGTPPGAELLERIQQVWEQEDVPYMLEEVGELLKDSEAGIQRVSDIVQSLRTFARMDTGEPYPVDVNKELETTLKLVWNELKYKCQVKCDLGRVPKVLGMSTQLGQVFTNLLLNAGQAMEKQGEVRITTRHEAGEVVVRISDTGHGMTPETLSRLFTPFFTTKAAGQGTGLGLSISYGIVSRHNGRIEVESAPGQGSTFTVRLPAIQP